MVVEKGIDTPWSFRSSVVKQTSDIFFWNIFYIFYSGELTVETNCLPVPLYCYFRIPLNVWRIIIELYCNIFDVHVETLSLRIFFSCCRQPAAGPPPVKKWAHLHVSKSQNSILSLNGKPIWNRCAQDQTWTGDISLFRGALWSIELLNGKISW